MVLTRRQILEQTLALPVLFPLNPRFGEAHLVAEDNHLSRESAEGFRRVIAERTVVSRPFVVFAGATGSSPALVMKLRLFMQRGGWVVWEQAPQAFPDHNQPARELYVRYSWPIETLVRSFGNPATLSCSPQEVIACFDGKPVAYRRPVGKGGWLHLGSMLGPHLRSGDREAQELARALVAPVAYRASGACRAF